MLRLTFLLCSGLFLVMLLGGRDFGQLRPGLAQAAAEAQMPEATAAVPVVETVALGDDAVVTPIAQVPEVVAKVADPVAPITEVPTVTLAPAPAVLPPTNTVFTLATYADVPVVPETSVLPQASVISQAPIIPEASGDGEIWYVAGNSLNVRSGPSTDDAVVGKLSRGEATLVVAREGEDWARIRIEGDGIEGYVAMRFLSAVAPAVN